MRRGLAFFSELRRLDSKSSKPISAAGAGLRAPLWAGSEAFRPRPGRPGGWWIFQEPQLHLKDVAGWRGTMPRLPQDHRFELAPDWVCGVLSPDRKNRRTDTQRKPPLYHREGV